jgi:hypothetical protein
MASDPPSVSASALRTTSEHLRELSREMGKADPERRRVLADRMAPVTSAEMAISAVVVAMHRHDGPALQAYLKAARLEGLGVYLGAGARAQLDSTGYPAATTHDQPRERRSRDDKRGPPRDRRPRDDERRPRDEKRGPQRERDTGRAPRDRQPQFPRDGPRKPARAPDGRAPQSPSHKPHNGALTDAQVADILGTLDSQVKKKDPVKPAKKSKTEGEILASLENADFSLLSSWLS